MLDVIVALAALAFVEVARSNPAQKSGLASPINPPAQVGSVNGLSSVTPQADSLVSQLTPTPPSLLAHITSLISSIDQGNKPLCNGPAAMYILLIGSDERKDDYLYGLADSIRIVRIDFTVPSVTMLDFPRDLWVEIPGIADHYGITHGKLNQAYFFGNPGMGYYDGPGEGPGLMAQTLQLNFGVQVDHYLAMDMKTFVRLVDAVDGIDIHIDSKIDLNENQDGTNPSLVFEPGDYHLDGTQALALARDRIPTIFQRARYQTMVLKAIERKLLTPAMISVWPQIIADFTRSVQTDLNPEEISKLVCLATKLNKESIMTVAFPDNTFASAHTYDPYRQVYTYTLDADFNQIRAYVTDFMNGRWP